MLINFYEPDGVTPYVETLTKMVGGTQENPILGAKKQALVVNCPGRKIGDKFVLSTNDGYSKPMFEVFEEGKAKKVFK